MRRGPPARRVALQLMTKEPPPPSYDVRPKNRAMRRQAARELRRLKKRAGGAAE